MSKSKKKSQHTYTSEQTEWIMEHPHLRRSELARKFNKKFDTAITPIAIAKRKQRMILEPPAQKSSKERKRKSFELKGESISMKELLVLVREQSRLIEKMIEKL
jgi:hypothetical protein